VTKSGDIIKQVLMGRFVILGASVTLAALSGELWRMEYLESTELRLPIVAMPSVVVLFVYWAVISILLSAFNLTDQTRAHPSPKGSLGAMSTLSLLVLFAITSIGCTTAPVNQFATYKDTFSSARSSGEHVLIDYAATKTRKEQRDTMIAAKRAKVDDAPRSPPRRTYVAQGAGAGGGVNEVAVYMKAWEVIARYNDFLTAIIEGKETGEIEAAYQGFKVVSANLPEKLAKGVSKALGPWQSVVDLAVEAAAAEARRQRFIAKVKEGAPVVAAMFKILRDDVPNFAGLELAVNDIDRAELMYKVRATRLRIKTLLDTYDYADRQAAMDSVKERLLKVPGYADDNPSDFTKEDGLAPKSTPPAGTVIAAGEVAPERIALNGALKDIEQAQSDLLALQADLDARLDVLGAYDRLLAQVEDAVRNLALAAQYATANSKAASLPDPEILRRAIIEIRKLIELRDTNRRAA